jgi:hypothetical protein
MAFYEPREECDVSLGALLPGKKQGGRSSVPGACLPECVNEREGDFPLP